MVSVDSHAFATFHATPIDAVMPYPNREREGGETPKGS